MQGDEARAFERLEGKLVGEGHISAEEIENIRGDYEKYEAYRRSHTLRGWPQLTPVGFVESRWPYLSFQAWAAWHDKEMRSVDELCREAMPQFGESFFGPREFEDRDIAPGTPMGQILFRMGAITQAQLDSALLLQKDIVDQVGVRILLGILLVRRWLITMGEYYQSLAIHYGVAFTGVNDETIERIRVAQKAPPR